LALVDGPLRITYSQLHQLIEQAAARLLAASVQPGDRVAILLENRADMVVAILAIARIGAISVPMNVRQRQPETEFALNQCGAVALLHETSLLDHLPRAAEVPALRNSIGVNDNARLWDWAGAPAAAPSVADEDAPFCILYTSGTTGKPKGAVLTHFSVAEVCQSAKIGLGLSDGEVSILAVPGSHVTGVVLILLLTLDVAGCTVLQRAFKARDFLRFVAAERVTYTTMAPAMYTLALLDSEFESFDLSSWRYGAYGGAPMPEAAILELARRAPHLRLFNIYGATETSSAVTMTPFDQASTRAHQVGRPLDHCEVLVMDDEGREAQVGDQGEIWIGGSGVIPRYWNNEQATVDSFISGFWKSGDIGSKDSDGYLTIHDRKKDVINRGGYKIYSAEVENVLCSHEDVVEAGVVSRPCPVLGERVVAFVVGNDALRPDSLRDFCAQSLSDYKVPEQILCKTEPLPRNANGKLLKAVLRSWLMDDDAPSIRSEKRS
jgi:O-succinylbenzoic acid--CoA ligase